MTYPHKVINIICKINLKITNYENTFTFFRKTTTRFGYMQKPEYYVYANHNHGSPVYGEYGDWTNNNNI